MFQNEYFFLNRKTHSSDFSWGKKIGSSSHRGLSHLLGDDCLERRKGYSSEKGHQPSWERRPLITCLTGLFNSFPSEDV